jgi:hypothetical protein
VVQLAPPAAVPPILVGGMSDAALARAAERGDGWFAMTAAELAEGTARLAELAAARNRPVPQVTASMLAALTGDPALPDEPTLTRQLADVDGPFGIPADYVPDMLVIGTTDQVAAHLADAAHRGARRVVATFAGGDWHRQAELLADARALLGLTTLRRPAGCGAAGLLWAACWPSGLSAAEYGHVSFPARIKIRVVSIPGRRPRAGRDRTRAAPRPCRPLACRHAAPDALLGHPLDPASTTDMIDSVYLPLVKAVSTPPGTSTPANGAAGITTQPRLDDNPAAAGPDRA